MATTNAKDTEEKDLWTVLRKEITGIQLLWEIVNGLYFQPQGKEWQLLMADAPLLIHLTQTGLMESLLMRVSRMMDRACTNGFKNLSLKQLVNADVSIEADVKTLRAIWNSSGLKDVRDKYLSHNDLNRSKTVDHSLTIPLVSADIESLRQLAEGLRTLRRNVNRKLCGGAYVDQCLDVQSRHDVEVLGKSLLGGRLFFDLLPNHPALQQALESAGGCQNFCV